ncbi:MAG: calcineurin-like phosphoesterase family protein [Micavibrio sp.]|nr:calcineurin-like phosphoesterase family protein [Micavibrio sp.]
MRIISFGVVTDIHYGFDQGNKKGSQAPRLLENFFRRANKIGVDFTVDLGDRVIYQGRETNLAFTREAGYARDMSYLAKVKEHFNKAAAPHYSVNGNHDLGHMSANDNARILGMPETSYSHDIKGVHFVFWNPNVRVDANREMHATAQDLQWLKDNLAKTANPAVIFCHIPFDDQNETPYVDKDDPTKWIFPSFYAESKEIRKILEDSGKVIECHFGHLHRNRHSTINGIHYFEHQSLVQKNENTGHARNASYIVTIDLDNAETRIRGFGKGQKNRIAPLTL